MDFAVDDLWRCPSCRWLCESKLTTCIRCNFIKEDKKPEERKGSLGQNGSGLRPASRGLNGSSIASREPNGLGQRPASRGQIVLGHSEEQQAPNRCRSNSDPSDAQGKDPYFNEKSFAQQPPLADGALFGKQLALGMPIPDLGQLFRPHTSSDQRPPNGALQRPGEGAFGQGKQHLPNGFHRADNACFEQRPWGRYAQPQASSFPDPPRSAPAAASRGQNRSGQRYCPEAPKLLETSCFQEETNCFLAPPHRDGALFGKQLALDMEIPTGTLFQGIAPNRGLFAQQLRQPSDMFMAPPHPDGALYGRTRSFDAQLAGGCQSGFFNQQARGPPSLEQIVGSDTCPSSVHENRPSSTPGNFMAGLNGNLARPISRGSQRRKQHSSQSMNMFAGSCKQDRPQSQPGRSFGFSESHKEFTQSTSNLWGANVNFVGAPVAAGKWLATLPVQGRPQSRGPKNTKNVSGVALKSVPEFTEFL